ncbi:hypothetical protein V9T40_011991 [Parthenolecanium corni]|uniref:Uncharacterized protein n=1 Tax=Parthenolecanium corni TaxID=536013 RepID=A0AAN9T709_9HEMI
MDKVLKRVTHHKKQSTNSSSQQNDRCSSSRPSSSPNKRYSVDDNFYMYSNKNELYQNCSSSSSNYYTMSNRKDFKRNTIHRSRADAPASEFERDKQLIREDVTFKKLLRMFNAGENGRGAKEWFTSNASNVMDFAPKILTKRFCSKKGENELYRSNSFKFERFERTDSDTLTMSKRSPVARQVCPTEFP